MAGITVCRGLQPLLWRRPWQAAMILPSGLPNGSGQAATHTSRLLRYFNKGVEYGLIPEEFTAEAMISAGSMLKSEKPGHMPHGMRYTIPWLPRQRLLVVQPLAPWRAPCIRYGCHCFAGSTRVRPFTAALSGLRCAPARNATLPLDPADRPKHEYA
jgi:hypothetical protein